MLNTMDPARSGRENESTGLFVPMDIYEQEGKIMVRCSVPGVKPEDLNVTIDQGMLTLSGETKNEYERKEGNRIYHREHTYGRFTRSVRLPEDIDENAVAANFDNGVLTVSIARTQQPEPKPKQIAINQGSSPQMIEQRPHQGESGKSNGSQKAESQKAGAKA